jgi:prepilin-type N-terminal cleavage/methylation domain-containing protein
MPQSQGFTLLELLISLTILSIALLGLDAAQLTSLHKLKSAYYFSVAAQQLDRMHAILSVIPDNDLTTALTTWNNQNQSVLPQGRGVLENRYPTPVISIFWGNTSANECVKPTIGQSGCLKSVS